jgi:NADH-quinone oxidoreductase subunit G
VLGSENLDAQFGDGLNAVLLQGLPKATIDEAANAKTVVTLSGDLREELPVLFLRLRENFTKRKNALVEFTSGPSALSGLAKVSLSIRPGEAHVVARAICDASDAPTGVVVSNDELAAARALLGDNGEGVVFVVGRPNLAEDSRISEDAIRAFAQRYPRAKFLSALRRSNVMGALDMGLGPSLRPGRRSDASVKGRDTLAQLSALRDGEQKAVLLLGGCLLGNVVDVDGAKEALSKADVVVVTGHGGATLAYANVVLPASVQHERTGTVTNIEGRVSTVTPMIVAPGSAWPDVAIAAELAQQLGQSIGLASVEEAARAIEESTGYPALSVLNDEVHDGIVVGRPDVTSLRHALDPMAVPGIRSAESVGLSSFTGAIQVDEPGPSHQSIPVSVEEFVGATLEIPLADAYALRVVLTRRLYDRGIAMQGSPALLPMVPSTSLALHQLDLDRLGVESGTIVTVTGPKGSARLPVEVVQGVVRGTVVVAFATLDESGANVVPSLVDTALISQVRLETR